MVRRTVTGAWNMPRLTVYQAFPSPCRIGAGCGKAMKSSWPPLLIYLPRYRNHATSAQDGGPRSSPPSRTASRYGGTSRYLHAAILVRHRIDNSRVFRFKLLRVRDLCQRPSKSQEGFPVRHFVKQCFEDCNRNRRCSMPASISATIASLALGLSTSSRASSPDSPYMPGPELHSGAVAGFGYPARAGRAHVARDSGLAFPRLPSMPRTGQGRQARVQRTFRSVQAAAPDGLSRNLCSCWRCAINASPHQPCASFTARRTASR